MYIERYQYLPCLSDIPMFNLFSGQIPAAVDESYNEDPFGAGQIDDPEAMIRSMKLRA